MTSPRGLHTLARLHGIQTAYHDNDGRRVAASPEALMAALRALGVELDGVAAIPDRVEHRRRAIWERAVDPVVVAWVGRDAGPHAAAAGSFRLRTAARLGDRRVRLVIGLEGGGERRESLGGASLEVVRSVEVGGVAYVERVVPIPGIPTGYHDLCVEVGEGRVTRRYEAVLIVAPDRAPDWDTLPAAGRAGGAWGLFAPLYAARDRARPEATPDYPLLGRFADRAAEAGAAVVGTLPLLAAFLDEPYEPSPYSPVSRLFWNELYVAPGEGHGGRGGHGRRGGTAASADSPEDLFDPRAAMAERRVALEAEAQAFFSEAGSELADGPPELAAFRARNPLADDYARFRALTEARGPWPDWPDRLRARDIRPDDYDLAAARYHLYVQYRAERQLAEVAERSEGQGVSLYLDLPMGVHPHGYDVWRERGLFVAHATAGAPPDPLATGGQNWGFPPLHPEASRLQGHRYFAASIRKHLRFAGVLRVDHVMQLHRMFWFPDGATDGVYVRYPAEELYAVLSLESHRAGSVIVGEDLGTVPREVRRSMRRRGLPGMYVLQFELEDIEHRASNIEHRTSSIEHRASNIEDRASSIEHRSSEGEGGEPGALRPKRVPAGALASIGTHDTPSFAGWWWGEDIRIRRELGRLSEEEAEAELAGRAVMREKLVRGLGVEHRSSSIDHRGSGAGTSAGTGVDPEADGEADVDVDVDGDGDGDGDGGGGGDAEALAVQEALLRWLGESDAGLVLATVEDLWLEREPQNVPGTTGERNWRRRWRRGLEALSEAPAAGLLNALNRARKGHQ